MEICKLMNTKSLLHFMVQNRVRSYQTDDVLDFRHFHNITQLRLYYSDLHCVPEKKYSIIASLVRNLQRTYSFND
jgi:hypothetical protein